MSDTTVLCKWFDPPQLAKIRLGIFTVWCILSEKQAGSIHVAFIEESPHYVVGPPGAEARRGSDIWDEFSWVTNASDGSFSLSALPHASGPTV